MNKLLSIILMFIISNCIAQTQYPGQNIIGKTYNVFGEFANNKSIQRYPIFDFSKVESKKDQFGHTLPLPVYIENVSDHIIKTVEGTSVKEYSENLAEKAGLKGGAVFFKGSIDLSTNDFNTSNEELFMYTYMDINTKWRVSLDTRNIDKMIAMLDDQFSSDIENLSPKDLFDNYGTHFITSAFLGGRIDYITSSKLTENFTKNEIKLAVQGSYAGISGNYSNNQNSTSKINTSITKTTLNVVGGNSEYTNNISDESQYKKWAEGIVKSPVLCGFDEKSLMPVWMLTKNLDRRSDLENYFNAQVLPKYPFPTFFKKDAVLDNENFKAHYSVYIDGFEIVDDCDPSTMFYTDDIGEFEYKVDVFQNDRKIKSFSSPDGHYFARRAGQKIEINNLVNFEFPLEQKSTIKIEYYLQENNDLLAPDVLGNKIITHFFPFSNNQLYNSTLQDGTPCYKQNLYYSPTCEANFNYVILPFEDPTAKEFGIKGWSEFKLGNYDQCINYSRKALEIDNTLWFAQFNVALVYLIQKNPNAFNKYQNICNFYFNKEMIKEALKDITDYESIHGEINGSEPIKLLLKSKLY
jgi:tetratricopeptide (TPR) repeat protein